MPATLVVVRLSEAGVSWDAALPYAGTADLLGVEPADPGAGRLRQVRSAVDGERDWNEPQERSSAGRTSLRRKKADLRQGCPTDRWPDASVRRASMQKRPSYGAAGPPRSMFLDLRDPTPGRWSDYGLAHRIWSLGDQRVLQVARGGCRAIPLDNNTFVVIVLRYNNRLVVIPGIGRRPHAYS